MTRIVLNTVLGVTMAALSFGCSTAVEGELTAEEQMALGAALEHVERYQDEIPLSAEALEELAIEKVLAAKKENVGPHQGIVSGLWYDVDIKPVFEGAWFELGSGRLGGSVDGQYADGQYSGEVFGPDIEGSVVGPYDQGFFAGRWQAAVGPESVVHHGELEGYYQRHSELGGYFFGLWTDCGEDPSASE